ncbi:LANO_0A01530g1_1 [Lachancea nothofagi CBS 11611]|uniref:Large ribosomal subunit protein mL49 n=1 Tax=Lachancea nothofagi CBS 11611 TaxID=1266666 RepID=A0A1G4IMQ2_9SACH|nr:LANO_0A01530g1_1 [Lachancea nothofagi CBS 11611]
MLSRLGFGMVKRQTGSASGLFVANSRAVRLVSTETPVEAGESVRESEVGELTTQEISDLSQAISEPNFSIFPTVHEVRPEEIVGYTPFGVKSYFVERSATGNLPVYTDFKSGGKVVTEIRKIHGDPVQLRNDLQARLTNVPKSSFKVLMQAKKIVIEGDVVRKVKNVLSTSF